MTVIHDRFDGVLTRSQLEKATKSKCLNNLRRIETLTEHLIGELQKLKEHYEQDRCRCILCNHRRRTDPGLAEDLAECCGVAIWQLRFFHDMLDSNTPRQGFPQFRLTLSVDEGSSQ